MINFTEDAVQQMVQEDPASPVVMLNLLRFRPDGGEASYHAYLEHNAAVWARRGPKKNHPSPPIDAAAAISTTMSGTFTASSSHRSPVTVSWYTP